MHQAEPETESESEPRTSRKRFEFLVLILMALSFVVGAIIVLFFAQASHTIFVPTDEFVQDSKTVDVLGYPKASADESFHLTPMVGNAELLELRNVPNGHLAVLKMRLYDKLRLLFTSQDLFICDSELNDINDVISVD